MAQDNSLESTRQFLSKFVGGSIKLTKHEESGIAFIEINHMEKRNAISGRFIKKNL